MKALILCAGKGTRLGLKKTPKSMVKVNGKPILEHLVNHLNKAGITEIIVNVHKDYDKIFKYFGTRLLYFYEPILLGEAGTEQMLKAWLGDEYIVMNGDTLNNIDLAKFIEGSRNSFSTMHFYYGRNDHYAGTKYVKPGARSIHKGKEYINDAVSFLDEGEYYFDCGTPKKLAKARRYYAKHR